MLYTDLNHFVQVIFSYHLRESLLLAIWQRLCSGLRGHYFILFKLQNKVHDVVKFEPYTKAKNKNGEVLLSLLPFSTLSSHCCPSMLLIREVHIHVCTYMRSYLETFPTFNQIYKHVSLKTTTKKHFY